MADVYEFESSDEEWPGVYTGRVRPEDLPGAFYQEGTPWPLFNLRVGVEIEVNGRPRKVSTHVRVLAMLVAEHGPNIENWTGSYLRGTRRRVLEKAKILAKAQLAGG